MKRIRNYAVLPENVFKMINVSGYSNATEKAIKIIKEMSDQVFEVSKNE